MLYSTVNTYFSEILIQLFFYQSSLPATHLLFMKHLLCVRYYVWVEGTKVNKKQSRPSRASYSACTQAITLQCDRWGPQGQHLGLRGRPQGRPSEKGGARANSSRTNRNYSGRDERVTQAYERHKNESEFGDSLAYGEYSVIGQEHWKREVLLTWATSAVPRASALGFCPSLPNYGSHYSHSR